MRTIFDSVFAANPWPTLHQLRQDGGVHRVRTPDGQPAWLVTGHADVHEVLLDDRFSTNLSYAKPSEYRGFEIPAPLDAMQRTDRAEHLVLRRLIQADLSPRRLSAWSDRVADLVERIPLADDVVDLVAGWAVPLPAVVIGDLLGLNESRSNELANWATATLTTTGATQRARDTLPIMGSLLAGVLEDGRRDEDTMISRLVTASRNGECSTDQLTGLVFYLLFVWYEVLVDLLSGSVLALSTNPDQRRQWVAGASRWPTAVDELLRYLSPQVLASPRYCRDVVMIGGHTIGPGESVLACLAAANHDPAVYSHPDDLNIARSPNPHAALGHGLHACLGTTLVRTVTATALDDLFTRWPNMTLAVPATELTWRSGFRHRGPEALPMIMRPASVAGLR